LVPHSLKRLTAPVRAGAGHNVPDKGGDKGGNKGGGERDRAAAVAPPEAPESPKVPYRHPANPHQ
jgi:hypothetical protein